MGACNFILRVGFLAFFALNAWNTLHNAESHTTKFKQSLESFEASVHSRTGLQFPEFLRHSNVHKHSDLIVKGVAWAQLALAAASLLICGGLTCFVGMLYFFQQIIHLKLANLSAKTTFAELEHVALAFGLLVASFAISGCYKYSKHCSSSVNTDRSQAHGKKKN